MSKLTNYIKKEFGKGFSKNAIRKKLIKAGYDEDQIEQSFAAAEGKQETTVIEPKKSIPNHIAWKKIFGIIIIICIALLFLVGLMWVTKMSSKKVASDDSVCDDVAEEERNFCFLKHAKEQENPLYCDYIIGEGLMEFCKLKKWEDNTCTYEVFVGEKDQCMVNKAIAERDTLYCDDLTDAGDCYKNVAMATNDLNFCEGRIKCISSIAIEKNDPTLCDHPSIADLQMLCLRGYAIGKNDQSYCSDFDGRCLSHFTTES